MTLLAAITLGLVIFGGFMFVSIDISRACRALERIADAVEKKK